MLETDLLLLDDRADHAGAKATGWTVHDGGDCGMNDDAKKVDTEASECWCLII